MDNKPKASRRIAALINTSAQIQNQDNEGRRKFVCDPEARCYPMFRTDEAADYYTECAGIVPDLAKLHGEHILAFSSCIAQQQSEIAHLRAAVKQLQNSIVTTQAARDVLSEITKLVKSGKSVTNASVTLRSKGTVTQRKRIKNDSARQSETEEQSFDHVVAELNGILSFFGAGACFDSTAAKASLTRLREVERGHIETADNSESQVEVKIGIGHLG